MEQSVSWDYNSRSVGQEIPRRLWNSKVHNLIYKSVPLDSLQNHFILVHTLIKSCVLNIFLK
jgi:hypothetical protein